MKYKQLWTTKNPQEISFDKNKLAKSNESSIKAFNFKLAVKKSFQKSRINTEEESPKSGKIKKMVNDQTIITNDIMRGINQIQIGENAQKLAGGSSEEMYSRDNYPDTALLSPHVRHSSDPQSGPVSHHQQSLYRQSFGETLKLQANQPEHQDRTPESRQTPNNQEENNCDMEPIENMLFNIYHTDPNLD